MNQSKSKLLRALFLRIQPFPDGDPRNTSVYRSFKARYQAQPSNKRAAYLAEIEKHIIDKDEAPLAATT